MVKVLDGAEGGGVFRLAMGRLRGERPDQRLDHRVTGRVLSSQLVASSPLPRACLEDAFTF